MTTTADNTHNPAPATEPLALRLSEGLGAWSPNKPTAPGHYWVWQPNDAWPCRGRVHLVEVVRNGSLSAWVPYMDYADSLQCDTWNNAVWCGPVAAPEAPNVEANLTKGADDD